MREQIHLFKWFLLTVIRAVNQKALLSIWFTVRNNVNQIYVVNVFLSVSKLLVIVIDRREFRHGINLRIPFLRVIYDGF